MLACPITDGRSISSPSRVVGSVVTIMLEEPSGESVTEGASQPAEAAPDAPALFGISSHRLLDVSAQRARVASVNLATVKFVLQTSTIRLNTILVCNAWVSCESKIMHAALL